MGFSPILNVLLFFLPLILAGMLVEFEGSADMSFDDQSWFVNCVCVVILSRKQNCY